MTTAYVISPEQMQVFMDLQREVAELRGMVERLQTKPDAVLTVEQVAEMLSMHPETIRRMIRNGLLQSVAINLKARGVLESELHRFLNRNEKKTRARIGSRLPV